MDEFDGNSFEGVKCLRWFTGEILESSFFWGKVTCHQSQKVRSFLALFLGVEKTTGIFIALFCSRRWGRLSERINSVPDNLL